MKRILQHTTLWLIICCLTGINVKPWSLHSPCKRQDNTFIDAHHDNLPANGKEEKTQSLKLVRNVVSICYTKPALVSLRFFEHARNPKRQIYLPVILPPPKTIA